MKNYFTAPHPAGVLDVSDIPRQKRNLQYTAPDGAGRPFDLYYPDRGCGPFPLIINICGGGWYYGNPTSIHLGRALHCSVARGYAFASLACVSSGEKKFPYQIQEARQALRHLRRNAGELCLDPNFFAFWSSSSGAHLSLMTALTRGEPYFDAQPDSEISDAVAAVAAVYPCCRLEAGVEDFRAVGLEPDNFRSGPNCAESVFLGALVEESPELCRLAAPITHVRPGAPPLALYHGTRDTVVPYTFTQELARRYEETAGKDRVQLHIVPGAGHGDPCFKSEETCGAILDFMDSLREGSRSDWRGIPGAEGEKKP